MTFDNMRSFHNTRRIPPAKNPANWVMCLKELKVKPKSKMEFSCHKLLWQARESTKDKPLNLEQETITRLRGLIVWLEGQALSKFSRYTPAANYQAAEKLKWVLELDEEQKACKPIVPPISDTQELTSPDTGPDTGVKYKQGQDAGHDTAEQLNFTFPEEMTDEN